MKDTVELAIIVLAFVFGVFIFSLGEKERELFPKEGPVTCAARQATQEVANK